MSHAPGAQAPAATGLRAGLEEVEHETERNGRIPFFLSRTELKLLGITGVRHFRHAWLSVC